MSTTAAVYNARVPEKRNRLTVFFRLILVIPHFIVLLVYAIGAGLGVIAAWFALLFTGRYPAGIYSFVSGVLQYSARLNAYLYLQVDKYPPFSTGPDDTYPAVLTLPAPQESYSRLKVFFRLIYGIPVIILGYAFGLVAEAIALAVWLVCLVTGTTPAGLHSALNLGVSYSARYGAFFALLVDDWPSITDGEIGGGIQVEGSSDGGGDVPPAPSSGLPTPEAPSGPDPFGRS